MRNKCKITNCPAKQLNKILRFFKITVTDYDALLSRDLGLAIKICLKTCLPRINLRQIILLRGYIHPNEQPVIFIPYMLCLFAAYWWFYIYRACAETSTGTFLTPGKMSALQRVAVPKKQLNLHRFPIDDSKRRALWNSFVRVKWANWAGPSCTRR